MSESFKARMKRLRLRAGFKSQQEAAEAIGCERGTVGMWEAPSSSVDTVSGEYLIRVAAAYKVRPDYINSGEGEDGYPWSSEAAPLSVSRPVRLDQDIVRGVARAMQEVFEELRYEGSVADTIAIFAELYDRVGASGITTADVVWLTRRVEQGAASNAGRSNLSNG